MKNLRIFWWFLSGLLRRYNRRALPVLLIVIGLTVIFLTAKSSFSSLYHSFIAPIEKPILTEGLIGGIKTLNPILATTDAERDIDELVFRSLVTTNEKGEPVKDLAEDFSVANNREYNFRLKDNIFWHDGKKFTADDVVFTISVAQNPNFKSPYYETLKDVQVEKISDYEVKITLKKPFAPFLSLIDFGIIPAHIPMSHYRPVGTGSFSVVSVKENSIVLKGEKFNLLFRLYATRDLALTALRLGEIQALGGATPMEAQEFARWPTLSLYHQNLTRRYLGLFLNLKNEKLQDKSIRQALQMATSKQDIIKQTTNNQAKEASSSIPLKSWVSSYTNTRYQYNPIEAGKLLDKAGWKMGESGVRTKDGKDFVLTITALDNKSYLDAVKILSENWGRLGIKTQQITINSNQLKENVLGNNNYEILLMSQEVAADPDQYALWHSTEVGKGNIASLNSAKVDKSIEDGRQNLDNEQRKKSYQDFQRLLSDESPVIYLYYPDYYYIVATRVTGIDLETLVLPHDRYNSISKWVVVKNYL